jgi:hypothetical protein
MDLKTFVINLDKHIGNYNKQKIFLQAVGLDPVRFSAINAIENEHLKHTEHIHKMALILTPKSTIGCGLSHSLLIKLLSTMKDDPYFLIMEDDAFPIYEKEEFQLRLFNTIKNISILDKDWDIIQLHSDAIFPCHETYVTHYFSGSTAAYLISKKGIKKMITKKVKYHTDLETSMDVTIRKYRARENLFWTDETSSLQRVNTTGIFFDAKVTFLSSLMSLRGEKTWNDLLNFKMMRIPGSDRELIFDETINYIMGAFIIYKSVHIVNNKLLK